MIASAHILAGAAIVKLIPNKAIAYPLAFLSHFLLDAIAHRDYETNGHFKGFKSFKFWLFVLKLELDVFISLLIINITVGQDINYNQIIIGGFLGFLPDLFLGLSHIFRGFNFKRCIHGESIREEVNDENRNTSTHRISNWYANLHEKTQNKFIHNKKASLIKGAFNYLLVIIITIIILFN
jgi:hypothetical protein